MGFDNHSSSESDDSNVRHDRFKSERFQKESSESSRNRENKYNKPSDSYRGSRQRERSPRASHRHRGGVTSSSSSSYKEKSKYEARSDHDRKDREKKSSSRSSRSDRFGSKHSNSFEKGDLAEKTKKNLSSLLKSFDQQVESKRSISDSTGQPVKEIGPALPVNLNRTTETEKNFDEEKQSEESAVDSALQVLTGSKAQSNSISSNNSPNNCGIELSLQKTNSLDIEHTNDDGLAEGPVLPPHLQNSVKGDHISCINNKESSSNIPKPNNDLPNSQPTLDSCALSSASKTESETYGPALPPKIESSAYGPALPPKTKSSSYGPTLPPEFKNVVDEVLTQDVKMEQDEESDVDEDMVGPLPEGKMNMTQYQLDLRAANIKRKLEEEKSGSSKDVTRREEWMLELPPEKASNLGLGPRSFRKREGPDMSNRSDWTDTPADRLRKEELAKSGIVVEPVNTEEVMKSAFVKERNEVMDKISKQSRDDDRPKSLLELHQKKLKKKKKKDEKEGKKKERRPFDRNVDLQVNRFDDAQKKAIYKKAQLLDTRFSTGESKYL